MTTLRNLVGTLRVQAEAAQEAAARAAAAARTEVAPIRDGLAETQHEVEQQGEQLTQAGVDLDALAQTAAALEEAVDILTIDMLMGGVPDV